MRDYIVQENAMEFVELIQGGYHTLDALSIIKDAIRNDHDMDIQEMADNEPELDFEDILEDIIDDIKIQGETYIENIEEEAYEGLRGNEREMRLAGHKEIDFL